MIRPLFSEGTQYYSIVANYGLHGLEPELFGFELSTWVQMKALIDYTIPKHNNASPIGKIGAPYGNSNAKKDKNKKQIINNQNNSNNHPNDNVNDNDNDQTSPPNLINTIQELPSTCWRKCTSWKSCA